ncbi:MAG: flavodoxin [Chloroflexota bacterium]
MPKIGLYFGSSTGNTEAAADQIKAHFDEVEEDMVEIHNVASGIDGMADYQYLILGCPTWDIGELQEDWTGVWEDFEEINFEGKTVAMFGMGDARGYPSSFVDAIGMMGEVVQATGGKIVGTWHPNNFEFDDSRALIEEGNPASGFWGLPLDEENQADWHEVRIEAWATVLKKEFEF